MSDHSGGFFKGFLLGGLIGSIIGVLLAPKSGRELRDDLSEEADKLFTHTKSDLEHARKAAMQSFEEGRNKIIDKLKPTETEDIVVEEEKPTKRERRPRSKNETK